MNRRYLLSLNLYTFFIINEKDKHYYVLQRKNHIVTIKYQKTMYCI